MRAHGVPEDRIEEVVRAYREDFGATGMHDATVFDGVPELLADLRAAGCRLVVATSKPEVFAVPICADLGLTPLLDGDLRRAARRVRHQGGRDRPGAGRRAGPTRAPP